MARTGRPRGFDRDQAVIEAMHLFWQHGYQATSLADLKSAIGGGITAPSFYAAFGSKEALFHETVARYMQTHGQVAAPLWRDDLPPREALELSLRATAKMQCESGHPTGCMIALWAMNDGDSQVLAPLVKAFRYSQRGIGHCIERGIATGGLATESGHQALCAAFGSFLIGLSALARDGASHQALDAAVSQIMRLWPQHNVAA